MFHAERLCRTLQARRRKKRPGIHASAEDLREVQEEVPEENRLGMSEADKEKLKSQPEFLRSTAEELMLDKKVDDILSARDANFKRALEEEKTAGGRLLTAEENEQLAKHQFPISPVVKARYEYWQEVPIGTALRLNDPSILRACGIK